MGKVEITNLTRREAPVFPYGKVAKSVLPTFDISLAFVESARAQTINKATRGKTYIPNVLSYATSEASGEIIICLPEARRQAPLHHLPFETFVLYLFIHGLLHLDGQRHGTTMEKYEQELLARFATGAHSAIPPHETTHRNRDRHRHLPSQGSRC